MSQLRRAHGSRQQLLGLTILPITPLIDIALTLVCYMLLSATSGQSTRDIPVELPRAGSGQQPTEALAVTVLPDGAVRIAGRPVEIAAVAAAAAGAKRAVLHADAAAAHGKVVAVVDALRRAGVEKVYYATKPQLVDW